MSNSTAPSSHLRDEFQPPERIDEGHRAGGFAYPYQFLVKFKYSPSIVRVLCVYNKKMYDLKI